MKIIINYDFFNAILDANDGLMPMKLIRNNKRSLALVGSIFYLSNYVVTRRILPSIVLAVLQDSCFLMGNYVYNRLDESDVYKERANDRLNNLALEFKNQYVNTDYNLLLQSELIKRKYKVHLNKLKIPEFIEYKYVLVPTYDFNGNIKKTSIEQEHVIGSNDYILSLGSPKKELKVAYSTAR